MRFPSRARLFGLRVDKVAPRHEGGLSSVSVGRAEGHSTEDITGKASLGFMNREAGERRVMGMRKQKRC